MLINRPREDKRQWGLLGEHMDLPWKGKFAGRLGKVGDRKRTITFGREGQKESIQGKQTRIGGHLEDDLQTYFSRSFLEPMICPQ